MACMNYSMSITSVSPAPAPHSTPSPFAFSVASTRWRARPPVQSANLILRSLALILSFAAAISLAAVSRRDSKPRKHQTSFRDHPELVYCFSVSILGFVYTAYQLFKGICDITHRGIFITDKMSDYISFIFDQLAGYLFVSASSVAVPAIQRMNDGDPLRKAAIVSVCMSFASSVVIVITALLSGYILCKRIMW